MEVRSRRPALLEAHIVVSGVCRRLYVDVQKMTGYYFTGERERHGIHEKTPTRRCRAF